MTKPLALLCALSATGILAVTGVLYFANPNKSALHLPHFGEASVASEIFLPLKPSLEERIVRHRLADGTAADDVLMRDGTTKQIVYDSHLKLLRVSAYYKGDKDGERGPLMYEKTHDAQGHLASERHLRTDGSLEMDGLFGAHGKYVRHQYYPSSAPSSAPSSTPGPVQDPQALQVSVEQVFDAAWHPLVETDLRQDGTRQLVHTWSGPSQDLVTTYGEDGKTILSAEGKKNNAYYTVTYFPDGETVQMDLTNSYQGTTVSWYRQDPAHSLALQVTFDNSQNDQIVLTDAAGKPVYRQVWSLDYSGQPYSGDQPRVLDHIDHFNSAGQVDIKYDFDRKTHKITTVTYYTGDKLETYGARVVYTVGEDGFATKVQTFDAKNSGDAAKPLTQANGKKFVLGPSVVSRPTFTVPTLKEGQKLYGDPPNEEFDFD